jgi:hypothetical protein
MITGHLYTTAEPSVEEQSVYLNCVLARWKMSSINAGHFCRLCDWQHMLLLNKITLYEYNSHANMSDGHSLCSQLVNSFPLSLLWETNGYKLCGVSLIMLVRWMCCWISRLHVLRQLILGYNQEYSVLQEMGGACSTYGRYQILEA